MREREKYDKALLTIRFVGDSLTEHGVSIYDLAESLIAIQRIVHKAHLARDGRLTKGAFPSRVERPKLALQLGERRRSSDSFALVPILTDPTVHEAFKQVVSYVADGVVGYYVQDVLSRVAKKKADPEVNIFIGSIYTEVGTLVNRITGSGGVDAITIGSPAMQMETIASFDHKTKEYMAELKGASALGEYQEIRGKVYKLYPSSRIVAIRRSGGTTVSVHLEDSDFQEIRYHKERSPMFAFSGRPLYQFGIETKSVSEFQADTIRYLPRRDHELDF